MKCPKCGLINPESALWCDCGYDFKTGIVRAKCPRCGQINPGTPTCPECGYFFPTRILRPVAPLGHASDSKSQTAPGGLQLRAETHARLVQICEWVMLAVAFGAFLILCAREIDLPSFILLGVMMSLPWIIIWLWPVQCQTPGCGGEVRKTRVAISAFKDRLHYQCSQCASIYETEFVSIFGRITFEAG
jgi:hypothetical protein